MKHLALLIACACLASCSTTTEVRTSGKNPVTTITRREPDFSILEIVARIPWDTFFGTGGKITETTTAKTGAGGWF